ncbi:hypothetical protein B2J93_9284 [Marssonina coronariae]|uniref:Uncharacterized protein n=1 Tax=Diplocarpon coronariae TaxID=2795749 RepID=A0A218ZAM0_9HELO|nr:hypothetical protein B2J93_9284 [Marssonina coronariae]
MGVNKEARKFARKGDRLLGLVDSHSAICVQFRGDKLVFASIEVLDVFVSRYIGDGTVIGFRDLDLSSIAVGWKVLFGARNLENIDDYVDKTRCEDKQPTSSDRLDNFLGIPKKSQHTLWDHIPHGSIGRLLEVVEQLGGVKDVSLVYKAKEDRVACQWGNHCMRGVLEIFLGFSTQNRDLNRQFLSKELIKPKFYDVMEGELLPGDNGSDDDNTEEGGQEAEIRDEVRD